MSVKQHFVPLTGVGHQPEGTAGAQLQMRDLYAVICAVHHQASLLQSNWNASSKPNFNGIKAFFHELRNYQFMASALASPFQAATIRRKQ